MNELYNSSSSSDAPCGIGDLACNPTPSTLDNHGSSLDSTALLISLETEPIPRKEIDTASLDERKQQITGGDNEKRDPLDGLNDNSNNSNTLIERRRGTCLYLDPSFCSAIETAVTATAATTTRPVERLSTNAPIFTPKQSRHSILAQIERQNALLEKDPKSICIQSNELRGHYSTVQQLVTDYQPLYSPPLSNNDGDDNGDDCDTLTIDLIQQQVHTMDWTFWQALLQDPLHVANKTPHLLSIKLRAGIPPHARGLVWQAVCQSDCLHLETVYGQLCKDHSPHERVIKRDLTRTFPNVDMFKQENGPGQLALCRILVAYSLYDAHVGYCQGLAFLVGPLLMNMPEPQAFCVFVRMMETYEMRSMFTLNMEGLQLRLYQFSRLLEEHLPSLAAHLDKHSIHAAMYASQWFLTLFAYAFPLELVTRIYDILFVEGATETMMRVSIAMLQRSEQTILAENEFEDLLDCVTTRKLCAPYMDDWSDAIHDAMALSNTITRQKLEALENQYAQQGQQEKKKNEQVLVSRLGSFWRRKSTKSAKKSNVSSLERSVSESGSSMGGNNSTTPHRTKYKGHQARNSMHSVEGVAYSSAVMPPTPSTISTNDHDDITEELLQALDQLRREHSRTIDELFETRMDKKDVESERDALKMTIMELERRYQTSSPLNTTSSSSNSIPVVNDQYPSLHDCDTLPTSTTTSFVSCSNNNFIPAAATHGYGNNAEATCSVYNKNSTNSFDSADSLPSPASSPLIDSQQQKMEPSTSNSTSREDLAITFYDPLPNVKNKPSNPSLATTDDGIALRTELVRVKVDHFEVQQQCERLAQEVDDLQSRLDMVNEGQLALVEKLVTMKSEMDDLLLDKKHREQKWLDLVEENSRLTFQLEQQQQQPTIHFLTDRVYELEASLAATKVRLAEVDAHQQQLPSDDEKPPPRIGRSGSLYGRMWHAISPRSPALRS